MEKLLELEKKLREAKASLEKGMDGEDVNGSLCQSEKHPDEKEDKRLIAEAIDTHNEKKHGEDKDKNSAYKDMKIKKEEGDVIKMEEINFAKNGQWSLDKAVRKPEVGSYNSYEMKPGTEGHAPKKKYQGGDPRHAERNLGESKTRAGNTREVPTVLPGKAASHTSGVSSIRTNKEYLDVKKEESLDKGLGSKLDNAEHKERVSQALGSIRQPAKVTNAAGETKEISPSEQVANVKNLKANKAAEAKAEAEAEAAERRASYKKP